MGENKGKGWSLGLAGLRGPAAFWLGIFFLAPLALILAYSFGTSGIYGGITLGFNPGNYLKVFDPLYLQITVRTLVIATLTTLFCLALGYPLAYFIALRGGRWKNVLLIFVMVPFWTSLLIRAYAWVVILGGNGLANRALQFLGDHGRPDQPDLHSPGVLMGMVYSYLPFMILPLYATLEKFDVNLKEAAKDLGASRWHTFWRVTFPLSMPGVIAAASWSLSPPPGSSLYPNLLGGSQPWLLGNLIQQQFLNGPGLGFWERVGDDARGALIGAIMFYVRRVGTDKLGRYLRWAAKATRDSLRRA